MMADHRGTEGAGGEMKRGMEGRNRKGKKKRGRPTAIGVLVQPMALADLNRNDGQSRFSRSCFFPTEHHGTK